MKQFFKLLKIELSVETIAPITLIILYIALLVFLKGAIPSPEELLSHAASLYERYGYEVIFLGAMLEALVLVNLITPGILVVTLGAIFARLGQVDLIYCIVAASFGAMSGYLTDYLLGFIGFSQFMAKFGQEKILEKVKAELERSEVRSFGLGFVHPNLGAFLSLAAGTLRMNFLMFVLLALLSTIFWISFWGLLVYALGDVFIKILTKYFFVVVIMVLSAWILVAIHSRRR